MTAVHAHCVRNHLVSVIMPCYNAAPFLAEAIASVTNQTYSEVELIIVDDGSSDRSPEVAKTMIEKHPGRISWLSQEHEGPYVARNKGLSHASGELIAFLDADDWWREDFLSRMTTALSANMNCVLAYCGWQNVGLPGARGAPQVPPCYETEGKAERFLRAASPWPIHAALVWREAVDRVGGFQVYLPTCMDYDFWLRLGMPQRIVLVPEVMAFYRHHDQGQIVSTQWRQARNSWIVKKTFVEQYSELVADFSRDQLSALIEGGLLKRGYDNYWRRDLVSARKIFRLVLRNGGWGWKDLRYLLPASLLPEKLYIKLIDFADR